MDTRQLAAFCAVVDRKSFSQAAERLGVTQPAVSLQVRALEERLGQQLLDRSGRRVEPTEAGLRLYRSAQRMLQLEEHLLEDVAATDGGRLTGTLTLGASTGPGAHLVPLLLCEFQREHPDLRVALSIWDTHAVIERVAGREVELGVVGALRRHRSLVFEPLARDEIVLAVPPGHPAAGGELTADDLRAESLVVMQEGAGVRQVVEEELRRAGLKLRSLEPKLELGLQESVKSAVAAGYGVTFISRTAIEGELAAGTLGDRARRRARPVTTALRRPREGPPAHASGRGVPGVRQGARGVIVRWGLDAYPGLLAELGIERPLLVTTRRWDQLDLPAVARFSGCRQHVPRETVDEAVAAAAVADGLVALGGGSAIDTAKAVSAETGLPLVSIPTTYSGAEWTSGFGVRDEARGLKLGGGGAHVEGIVYEPELTLGLPAGESGGTALNALAHCAEALYVAGRNPDADREALAGAALIADSLPRVLADGGDLDARRELLEGAMHAGAALAGAGLGLGHAMAQALGGRYGIAHGALNAVVLPPALRFNEPVAGEEIARFGEAIGDAADAPGKVEELARLAGFERLRDLGVPESELPLVAEAAAERGGAKANPRPASPAEIAELLRGVW